MNTYPYHEEALLADIKTAVAMQSVNRNAGPVTQQAPLGQGIYDVIQWMCDLGESFGFRSKNVDGYCGWVEMGEGPRMVAVLAHLDTVDVSPDGWRFPPFEATVADGKLFGRGTCDDKGPAVTALHAMKAVMDSGWKPDKRIRLIFGGDEEFGSACMARYKETEELPDCAFTPDADYPVTYAEKGVLRVKFTREMKAGEFADLQITCENQLNVVPAYATGTLDGKLYQAHGKAAHAMEPEKGRNALLVLCAQMASEGREHPFLALANMASAAGLGIAYEDAVSGELTINPARAVVNGEKAELSCDIRIPVTVSHEDVLARMAGHVQPLGFACEMLSFMPPLYEPLDSPLVQTLQRVYKECTGRSDKPISTGGGTYARSFKNAVAFGAAMPGDETMIHQTNENWPLESMCATYQIIVNAIVQL